MGRYLGQHFLINKDKLREIVEALELKDGDTIVEIGPGHGELTLELRIKNVELRIIAIEKDEELAKNLEFRIKDLGLKNIEIIQGDVLKEIKNQISKIKTTNQKSKIIKNLKIVGNIPYYITGYLLRILGELGNKPSLIVLTIQKEVAERICGMRIARLRPSGSGNAKGHMRILKPYVMNLLAASVQFWAKPEIVGYVSKKDFKPEPKVDSAIVKLTPHKITNYQFPITNYYKLIKILFKQPRKTIMNNLLATSDKRQAIRRKIIEKLAEIGVDPHARPQNLSIEQIIELSTLF